MKTVCYSLLLCHLLSAVANAADLRIDGQPDEPVWQQAQVFDQFVAVEPYTQAAPPYQQRVRIVSLPEGLAVAFDIEQPAGVLRTKPQTQRDQLDTADRVNLIVDFDGKGQTAYNFTVSLANGIEDGIVSRNNFRNDWDGDWQHAVHETEHGWSVEMLIPWTITAMDPVDGPTRTIGVYLDRVLKSAGERYAFPALRFSQTDFVNTFAPVTVPAFSVAQSHVYPYVSILHDNVNDETKTRAGLDVFYKPSASFQLIGALNPDFGQVESDDLVVNFSAIEVFFSDKRPFFTENNDDFTLTLPDQGQLIYSRRIGGNRDDGNGISDIDAAIKLRGANGKGSIAYLGAQEADFNTDIGRRFQAIRPKYQIGDSQFGYVLLHTERPFLRRESLVHGADLESPLTDDVRLRLQVLESEVEIESTTNSTTENLRDQGGWLTLDINPSVAFQHTFEAVNYGADLILSDMGYVQRSNLRHLAWQSRYVQTGFAADALVQEVAWEGKIKSRRNQQGDNIGDMLRLSSLIRRLGGDEVELEAIYIQAGDDDRISRGNGNWAAPSKLIAGATLTTARRGDSSWELSYFRDSEGLTESFDELSFEFSYFFGDDLALETEFEYRDSPEWLLWEQGNQFNLYRSDQYTAGLAMSWFPAEQHEVRLKTQWLAIAANAGERYLLIDETMVATGTPVDDLNINSFGFQLRYRYQLGSLSDLFVVYGRGGFSESTDGPDSPGALFTDALALRDADQFLVKLRLAF